MNRKRYTSDPRYSKVLDNMDLLGIVDITTTRQDKNGTIVWRLPIKHPHGGQLIEVASFATGYVRNQNSGYSNYQLNKRNYKDEYFKDYKITWNDNNTDYTQEWTGKYRKFRTKTCILIPVEIDRLEYLISYCLKNYYIKHANLVPNGNFVPKWQHEWELEKLRKRKEEVRDHFLNKENDCGHYNRIRDLENKLDTIKRISEYGETE